MNWKWVRSSFRRKAVLTVLGAALVVASAGVFRAQQGGAQKDSAQQTAPQQIAPNAPKADPSNTPDLSQMPIIRSNVQLVTTPVTVFDSGGNFVYDLSKDEFKVYDNGQLADIRQFDSEMRRLSLVIVVETTDTTQPFLPAVRDLGSVFSGLIMGPQGEVAVLTYNDHVTKALDFTEDGDKLDTVLRNMNGRGSGMHMDDALEMALSMLDHRPVEDRKVAIIFSDGYNIGSQTSRGEIVKRSMNSNITIYGLGFSPLKGLWNRPVKDPQPDLAAESVARPMAPNEPATPTYEENIYDTGDIPVFGILLGLGEEAKKPLFKSSLQYFSRYSGGAYFQKWGKDTVQNYLNRIADEIHSQYEIAYAPSTPIGVGFHKIEVQVRRPGARVRARSGWFYQGEPQPGQKVK